MINFDRRHACVASRPIIFVIQQVEPVTRVRPQHHVSTNVANLGSPCCVLAARIANSIAGKPTSIWTPPKRCLPLLVMTWRSYRNIVGFVGCGAAQAASIAGASHGGYYPR